MASASTEDPNEMDACLGTVSYEDRKLTDEENEKLATDTVLSTFKQIKLEKEAQKNWDLFYKRNTTKFFKDRHWTRREFDDLSCNDKDGVSVKRKRNDSHAFAKTIVYYHQLAKW